MYIMIHRFLKNIDFIKYQFKEQYATQFHQLTLKCEVNTTFWDENQQALLSVHVFTMFVFYITMTLKLVYLHGLFFFSVEYILVKQISREKYKL